MTGDNWVDGSWAGLRVPCVPGYDIAAIVEDVGPGVTEVSIGDRVMAMTRFPAGGGGYAELAVVEADQVGRIAAGTSFVEAAATPLAAGTASIVLDRLTLSPGQRLLISGASGGVGLSLVQPAAHAGLDVVAVGRAATHDTMREPGCATMCRLRQRRLPRAVGQVDAVADLADGDLLNRVVSQIRQWGTGSQPHVPRRPGAQRREPDPSAGPVAVGRDVATGHQQRAATG